jgi:DNA repair photolyase
MGPLTRISEGAKIRRKMNATQAILPILQDLPALGRPSVDPSLLGEKGGVEYEEIRVREILNPCKSTRMPFAWTINPYRGCEFGCSYCYARYTHTFFDLDPWRDFEKRIFVKSGADRALEKRLKRTALHGQPIAIGTATDPYQPAELRYGVTRRILGVFERVEGLDLSITTKSPLVLRDLELLQRLHRKHSLTVNVSITTLDPELGRKLEIRAPAPHSRLDAATRLAEAGIATAIFCMPLMPGINAGSRQLLPIFEAAHDRGIFDVQASPLFLPAASRARFWPWLKDEFPHLVPRYQKLFKRRLRLSDADKDRLFEVFRRLRLEFGFPRANAGL